jgi:hypothetical protein
MVCESQQRNGLPSIVVARTSVRRSIETETVSKFGTVVRALWPIKPALNLAQRSGLTERGAQFIIDGKRKPNARAALAVYAEIIG